MIVEDLMTRNILTIRAKNQVILPYELLTIASIRHIPVIDDSYVFIGLVCHRDLLRAAVSLFLDPTQAHRSGIPIDRVIKTKVITTSPQTPISEAAKIMREKRTGCLPVIDKNHLLVGIITEADMLTVVEQVADFKRLKKITYYGDTHQNSIA